MKIIDRYLLTLIVKSSLFSLFAIGLVFTVFKFLEELNELDDKLYPISSVLNYIWFSSPSIFNSFIVLSLLLGVVLTLGSLNSNKELQIFLTGTISYNRIARKVIAFSVFFSFLLIIFFEIISPISYQFAENYKNDALGNAVNSSKKDFWFQEGNKFINIRNFEHKTPDIKLFVVEGSTNLLTFSKGKIIENANSEFVTGNIKEKHLSFDNQLIKIINAEPSRGLKLNFDKRMTSFSEQNPNYLSVAELIRFIFHSKAPESQKKNYIIEIILRLLRPFTLMAMILITIPFVFNFNRASSIGNRIFVSILVGVMTHLLSKIFNILAIKFDTMSYFAPIIPTLLIFLLSLFFWKFKLNRY